MAKSFEYVDNIDYKRISAFGQVDDDILIGFPSGMIHADSGEDISSIAEKLSVGAGPQTWTTNKMRVVGVTKTGKPKKARTVMTHHVDSIPARPFLEDGMSAGRVSIAKAMENHFKQLAETGKGNLERIAVTAIGEIQKFVRSGYYKADKPNSPTTIEAKDSDVPLIDTAQMLNSLSSVINGRLFGRR
jgi:hypothetical protein